VGGWLWLRFFNLEQLVVVDAGGSSANEKLKTGLNQAGRVWFQGIDHPLQRRDFQPVPGDGPQPGFIQHLGRFEGVLAKNVVIARPTHVNRDGVGRALALKFVKKHRYHLTLSVPK